MEQTWRDMMMVHWRADPNKLARHVPNKLQLDLFDGHAYVSAVLFAVDPFRLRGMPAVRGMRRFWQLNLRTYVRCGATPGVYFLRLDTSRAWPAQLGRLTYALPFERAEMAVLEDREHLAVGVVSRTGDKASLSVGFRRAGHRMPWYEPMEGSLDAWLLNRYTLFATAFGVVVETRVVHKPWVVQPAEARVGDARMLAPYGCEEMAFACAAETRTARIGLPHPARHPTHSPDSRSLAR
ncbi:DUF2071 domain-containing protein [Alicyclobacillus vulcanalis]|uniref:DUF2071 domain-containing protein n=1 Tax=Alicyclobacillus vulcanalis TaxID=252246 RepID=UPI001F3D0708|nr:DUF2071 domain-containing protein [Alicyclobacillus vulcanalis]